MTKEEKRRVLELCAAGAGYRTISEMTGISKSTVAYFLKNRSEEPAQACLQCGAKLEHTPHRKKRKFCSDKCRMLWWNSHQGEVNRQAYYTFTCQECGKEFISYGNDHRKYCSRKCYSDHRRRQKVSGEHAEVLSGPSGG